MRALGADIRSNRIEFAAIRFDWSPVPHFLLRTPLRKHESMDQDEAKWKENAKQSNQPTRGRP